MMDVAAWAFVVSAGALFVSICSLTWSVASTFIHPRPRVRVEFKVMKAVQNDDDPRCERAIQISTTNLGPNKLTLTGVSAISRGTVIPPKSTENFVIPVQEAWPLKVSTKFQDFGNFPQTIDVGQKMAWFMPIKNDYFSDAANITDFCLVDSFGRCHWTKRRHVRLVRESTVATGRAAKEE